MPDAKIQSLFTGLLGLTTLMSRDQKKPLIFIVDDQAMLLELAEATLEAEPFRIRKFTDPTLALQAFRRAKSKPSLLITDYAMGKMNGLDLIEKCKALHANLKTILVSGTMGAEIITDSPIKIDRFLGKPYQPASLLDLVQRVLSI